MPSRSDDQYFGGKRGSSRKAFDNMVKRYGERKGEQVFFAYRNKRKAQGKRGGGLARALRKRA